VIEGDLNLEGARIGGSIRFEREGAVPGCQVEGLIKLSNAQVSDAVDLRGVRLANPGGLVMSADRLEVGGGFLCGEGFRAEGQLRMRNCRIGGQLRVRDVELVNPGKTALMVSGCEIRQLALQPGRPVDGIVDLTHSQIGVLVDDPAGWPAQLRLAGATYQALEPPLSARARLSWLDRDPGGYESQPYEQLSAVYTRLGREADARTVRYAGLRRRRRTLTQPARAWGWLQDWTVGYGYRPVRAAVWLAALLIIGTAGYTVHPPSPLSAQVPPFSPVVYSLDLLLPLVDFGQQTAFAARGAWQWLGYALIAAGWLLATTVAAGIARTLSRQ
jgi:hypothetical protein